VPKRSITLAIVAFWLGMAGLFVYQVLWPRLMPSEPAMFPVDIVDEAGAQLETTSWLVTKNGGGGYRANTDWEYVADTDTFRSHCQLVRAQRLRESPRKEEGPWIFQLHAVQTDSSYYLTRAGEMTRLDANTTFKLAAPDHPSDGLRVSARVSGRPHAGRFVPHLEVSFLGPSAEGGPDPVRPQDTQRDAAPVGVLARGLVLSPLHPPRRLADLRPGQRWLVTLIDPFAPFGLVTSPRDARGLVKNAGGTDDSAADTLVARVLPDLETLFWEEKNEEVICRVVRCAGDDPVPALTLWVRERDGMLFKQEAVTRSGDVWTFVRRPYNYRMQEAPAESPTFYNDPARLAHVIAQTSAAGAVAPGVAPAGTLAQHAAALGVTQSQALDLPGLPK
jgi:hypothetical protein